jgi:hypothetical protein
LTSGERDLTRRGRGPNIERERERERFGEIRQERESFWLEERDLKRKRKESFWLFSNFRTIISA